MRKQDNTLLVVAVVAVAGYLAFRKGGVLNKTPAIAAPAPTSTIPKLMSPAGIALDQPSGPDLGIYMPAVDPTGMSLTFL